jgi:hypothetical protein
MACSARRHLPRIGAVFIPHAGRIPRGSRPTCRGLRLVVEYRARDILRLVLAKRNAPDILVVVLIKHSAPDILSLVRERLPEPGNTHRLDGIADQPSRCRPKLTVEW